MPVASSEQVEQFEAQGYVFIEDAVQGAELQRLQSAFDYWAGECKEEWLDQIEKGDASPMWLDIPEPLEKDEIFIDMLDHPSYFPLLQALSGGELLLAGISVRMVPPWPLAYTGWHPDMERSAPLHPKLQLYVEDVPPRGGEFGYVPGTHKTNELTFFRPQRNDTMPGHKPLPGKAGSVVVFNAAGLHTAMDNHTQIPRKSLIIGYHKTALENPDSRYASLERFCKTPARRKLLGLEV